MEIVSRANRIQRANGKEISPWAKVEYLCWGGGSYRDLLLGIQCLDEGLCPYCKSNFVFKEIWIWTINNSALDFKDSAPICLMPYKMRGEGVLGEGAAGGRKAHGVTYCKVWRMGEHLFHSSSVRERCRMALNTWQVAVDGGFSGVPNNSACLHF